MARMRTCSDCDHYREKPLGSIPGGRCAAATSATWGTDDELVEAQRSASGACGPVGANYRPVAQDERKRRRRRDTILTGFWVLLFVATLFVIARL